MKASENKYVFTSKKAWAWFSPVFVFSLFFFSCNNDEFRVGQDIVDGENMEMGETSFAVKAWTIPDPTADTLSGRVVGDYMFKVGDPSKYAKKIYLNLVGNYFVPGVCDVQAGFATRLQIGSDLPSFGDIVIDSVDMVVSYTPVEEYSNPQTGAFAGYEINSNIYKGLYISGYSFYGRQVGNPMKLEIYRLAEPVSDQYYYPSGTSVAKENYIPLTKKWKQAELILDETFKINLDTIYSKVNIADTTINYDEEGVPTDTTYKYADSLYPRMQFRLEKQYWQNILDHFKGQIITQESFQDYFYGLYFKAPEGVPVPLMMLNLNQTSDATKRGCYIRLYYHTAHSTGNKLDLDFTNSQTTVAVAANSIQTTLDPKIKAMINNPDTINGEKELYILPFGQTEVVVDLINEQTIKTIKENGWVINDAYVEFPNKNYNDLAGNTPAAELWMYRYPYSDQFIYWNQKTGYPTRDVKFYIPDQATFTQVDGEWFFKPTTVYGLNGTINENSDKAEFSRPGKYRMRVTRTLIDAVFGDQKPVKVGLRLPFGVTETVPNMSVLNGENLRLVVKYSKKKDNKQ